MFYRFSALSKLRNQVSVHTYIDSRVPDDIKTMTDSDSDGIPDLVDSSDEEPIPSAPEKTFNDYADIWLKKSGKFLEKQENNVRIFAMGPFLFAVNNIVPAGWMELVRNSGLIKYKKREMELSSLDWEEWAIADLVEAITSFMIRKLRRKTLLIQVLECISEIDNQKSAALTYNICHHSVEKYDLILKLWDRALKVPPSKMREKEAKCAVLYIAKLYEMVVMSLAKEAKDFTEEIRRSVRSKDGTDPMKFKDAGNEQYQHGKFSTAIDYYTKAAKADPFNHIFFGNRAQTYNRLKKFREALADGRRAVILKPDWPKGHYRYAQAFNELGRLDQAIQANKKGLEICKNNKLATDSNIRDLEHQGKDFRMAKESKETDEKIRKVIEETTFDDDDVANLPPHIRNLPGEKRVINLSRAFKAMGEFDKQPVDSVPEDTSSDEDPPELVDDDDDDEDDVEEVVKKNQNGKYIKVPPPVLVPEVKQNGHASPKVHQKTNGKKKPEVPVKASEIGEMKKLLADGNDAYSNGVLKNAVTMYDKALDLVGQYKPKHFDMDLHDVVALKYACGESAVSTGTYKFIMEGMEKFEDILANHPETKFPLAHYGRAKAFVALNRFSEAKVPLADAWKITNNTKLTPVMWPGTKNKIEENTHNVLKKRIEQLKLRCKYPPPADARCRYHSDDEDKRTVIYLMDPDFKGFVRIRCGSQCIIEFHTQCWKVYKCKFGDMDRVADKEMLDKNCPTPECHAVIIKIIIFKQDKTTKEIDSDKSYKPPVKPRIPPKKLPACSEYKLNRKMERKELRKKRKRELKEETDDLVEDIDAMLGDNKTEEKTEVKPAPTKTVVGDTTEKEESKVEGAEVGEEKPKPTAVLRRDDDDDDLDKYKIAKKQKPKKKKERERTKPVLLSLEVNFSDDHEKQLYGEHNADEEEEQQQQYRRGGREPFSVPNNLEHSVNVFERSYHKHEIPFDDITENLFVFFEDLLRAHGPLHVEDTKITSMFEDFPPEAKDRVTKVGGLSQFLQQSKKFAMIDSIVCLLVDAGKARSISLARDKSKNAIFGGKSDTLNPNAMEFEPKQRPNAWNVKRGDNSDNKNVGSKSENESKTIETASTRLFPEKATYKKGGGIDCLDDFSLNSPVKYAKPESRMHDLDSLDSIDDIDIFKRPKGNNSMDACEDIRWTSENDTESVKSSISDRESISSRGDLFEGRGLDDRQDLPGKILSVDSKIDLMSRSSSRSDVSDRNSDISDLMTKSYKSDQRFSSIDKSDVSEMMANTYSGPGDGSSPRMSPGPTSWPAPGSPAVRQGFGPIGSPVPSATDSSPSSVVVNRPAPLGSPLVNVSRRTEVSPSVSPVVIRPPPIGLNFGHTLKEEVTMATQKECQRMDNKFVKELANDTVEEMLMNGMIRESDRTKTLEQVSQDIWQDMSSQKNMGPPPTKTKKSMVDQYMKNHYEKKKGYSMNVTGFPSVTTSSIWSTGDDSIKNSNLSYSSFPPPPIAMPPSLSAYSPYTTMNFSMGQTSSTSPGMFTQPSPLSHNYPGTKPPLQPFTTHTVTATMAVQVSVETRTASTLTDPYEPYKEDMLRAVRERDHLQEGATYCYKKITGPNNIASKTKSGLPEHGNRLEQQE
ncbi:uncharacterized protein LOC117340273 isoform X2 [Pecten maximus]|uniref:uncharacterized protein LOC117340273 isoform X2 n=1 Tax=Pecten maximus TaxID=6579 RepID=UPI0014588CD4|nr:uncharacterized protein LOC117340273 isoform X2 [Pecten maximus]